MNDIKFPNGPSSKKPLMEVSSISQSELMSAPIHAPEPGNKVKVNFEKFVQLVATHDFEEVMKAHAHEDIILSTNLLTDLANAHEDEEPEQTNRTPVIFIVGILLGVIVTYLIIRFL